jgi:2-aminoethylphosphonate-pyruvate transaminase
MTDPAPLLLTPGPLTTERAVREAMLRDWGSRDPDFIALTAELRARLLAVAHGEAAHVAVPIQGSGTFVLEAAVGTLLGPQDKLLVLINGAYGERMAHIARRLGRQVEVLRWAEDEPVDPDAVAVALAAEPGVTHVALVHCETTSGILNPLGAVAAAVKAAGRTLILDAMSSFGALPIDLRAQPIAAILASSNKCLEGTPGLAFAIVEREVLAACEGRSASLSLDLHAQWRGLEANGQWRFTPPVQVAAALVEALRRLEAEGGPAARLRRYQDNLDTLVEAATDLGLRLFLDRAVQAPIIATFHPPSDAFVFEAFYDALARRGFIIYPGKLTRAPSFRIGCIGAVNRADFARLSAALGPALAEAAVRASAEPGSIALSGCAAGQG